MAKTKTPSTDDWEQTSAVDPHPTWRPTAEHAEINAAHHRISELPPVGYPVGEEAVTHWFEKTFKRTPAAAEVGIVIDAMVRRQADEPPTDPPSERVFRDRSPTGTG